MIKKDAFFSSTTIDNISNHHITRCIVWCNTGHFIIRDTPEGLGVQIAYPSLFVRTWYNT